MCVHGQRDNIRGVDSGGGGFGVDWGGGGCSQRGRVIYLLTVIIAFEKTDVPDE